MSLISAPTDMHSMLIVVFSMINYWLRVPECPHQYLSPHIASHSSTK